MTKTNHTSTGDYGNQLALFFVVKFVVAAGAILISSGLSVITFLFWAKLFPQESGDYLKLFIGGPGTKDGYIELVVRWLWVSGYLLTYFAYARTKSTFIRDFAIYETMLKIDRLYRSDYPKAFLYKIIHAKVYRYLELIYGFVTGLVLVFLLVYTVNHLIVKPKIKHITVSEEEEKYTIKWVSTNSARCVRILSYLDEPRRWAELDSNCLEHGAEQAIEIVSWAFLDEHKSDSVTSKGIAKYLMMSKGRYSLEVTGEIRRLKVQPIGVLRDGVPSEEVRIGPSSTERR